MLYFAYGSNMDPEQMKDRCPRAEVVGIGCLGDHALCFPRRSMKRNCGVSSIEAVAGHDVWGVVYWLTPADADALDLSEGYRVDRPSSANSYNRVQIIVELNGETAEMVTYIAERQDNAPMPNAAYLRHIRDGARHHGLPASYLAYLAALDHA